MENELSTDSLWEILNAGERLWGHEAMKVAREVMLEHYRPSPCWALVGECRRNDGRKTQRKRRRRETICRP
jgi:hypothetical protein